MIHVLLFCTSTRYDTFSSFSFRVYLYSRHVADVVGVTFVLSHVCTCRRRIWCDVWPPSLRLFRTTPLSSGRRRQVSPEGNYSNGPRMRFFTLRKYAVYRTQLHAFTPRRSVVRKRKAIQERIMERRDKCACWTGVPKDAYIYPRHPSPAASIHLALLLLKSLSARFRHAASLC